MVIISSARAKLFLTRLYVGILEALTKTLRQILRPCERERLRQYIYSARLCHAR